MWLGHTELSLGSLSASYFAIKSLLAPHSRRPDFLVIDCVLLNEEYEVLLDEEYEVNLKDCRYTDVLDIANCMQLKLLYMPFEKNPLKGIFRLIICLISQQLVSAGICVSVKDVAIFSGRRLGTELSYEGSSSTIHSLTLPYENLIWETWDLCCFCQNPSSCFPLQPSLCVLLMQANVPNEAAGGIDSL